MEKKDLVFPTMLRQTGEKEFRLPFQNELNNPLQNHVTSTLGLTKRELFAAMAMQGLCADPEMGTVEKSARLAVLCADALLKELNKTE